MLAKNLPFVIPKVCTYPYFTAILAILSAKGKEAVWLYNNFILVWAMKKNYYIDYWIDFKFGDEENRVEFCPMIDNKKITREQFHRSYGSLREAIKKVIDLNCYLMISVDVYYISSWWGNEKHRRHFRHEFCVHGYDYEEDILVASDFIQGKYSVFEVKYKEFEEGYLNYRQYLPYEEYGETVSLLACTDTEEEVDLKRIRGFMLNFLNSEDTYIKNHIQLEGKEENYVFGFKVLHEISEYLAEVKKNGSSRIDVRSFHVFTERQRIMEWRYLYLYEKYPIIQTDKKVPELIRRQCKAAKQQEGLVLKYNATGQIEIVDELRNRLDLFMRNEEKLLEGCLRLLDEIR